MNRCFCDLCGEKIEFNDQQRLVQIKIGAYINGPTNDEVYIEVHLNHLCYDCRLKFMGTVSDYIKEQRRINGLEKT